MEKWNTKTWEKEYQDSTNITKNKRLRSISKKQTKAVDKVDKNVKS